MAHAGGIPGADAWVLVLERLIAEEPEPPDVPTAIGPLAQLGVDKAAVQDVVDRYLDLPEADWHPDDWWRSHPEFPRQYAAVAHVYTHEGLGIYRVLGEAMRDVARDRGPGGVSPRMKACVPLIKLLDVGLVEAAILWGFFEGQTLRGVKYAYPRPIVADHDPERHFPVGREFHWFEFNSSATDAQVMYAPYFCGRRGPRTIFHIQSCEGVSVKKFSAIPNEEEVLFRPLARFRVTGCTKMLTEGDLRDDVHPNNGFPDNVQLQQLSTFDPMAVLRAKAAQFRPAAMLAADRDRARQALAVERSRREEVEVALEDERQRVRQAHAELQRCQQALREQEARIAQMQQRADGLACGGARPPAEAVPPAAAQMPGAICKYCRKVMPAHGQRECEVRNTAQSR